MKLTYLLYRLGGVIVPITPPRLGYTLCHWLGGIIYRFHQPSRTNIQLNLRRILGPQASQVEINRRARAAFSYILYNYFDLFRLPALDPQTVEQLVSVSGWGHVEAALTEGRGLVMISAHLGNIEVILYALLLRGLAITIPVERLEPPELFEYICALRMSHGLKLIPVDGSLLDLVRTLKKGGVAGLAGDRDITGTGQVVNFFGYPAYLPDGHVRLALKTGAPLMVGFSRRNPDHTYEAYFLPAFKPPPDETEEERVAAGMRFVVSAMEKAISQNPEQWSVTVSIWADLPAS
jgi:KDO2-lipid IV(A) lauroyltransferase